MAGKGTVIRESSASPNKTAKERSFPVTILTILEAQAPEGKWRGGFFFKIKKAVLVTTLSLDPGWLDT